MPLQNTRLLFRNLARTYEGTICINGGGGNAGALNQQTGFPMSNVLNPSRNVVWISNTGTCQLDILFSSAQTVAAFAVLGYRPLGTATSGFPTTVTMSTATADPRAAGTWTAVTGGTFTLPAPLAPGVPDSKADAGVIVTPLASKVAVRFAFGTPSQPFVVGSVWVGTIAASASPHGMDMGVSFSDQQVAAQRYRTQVNTLAGTPLYTDLGGGVSRSFVINFGDWGGTEPDRPQSLIDYAIAQPYPLCLFDAEGRVHEVVPNPALRYTHKPGGPDGVMDASLELVSLP